MLLLLVIIVFLIHVFISVSVWDIFVVVKTLHGVFDELGSLELMLACNSEITSQNFSP